LAKQGGTTTRDGQSAPFLGRRSIFGISNALAILAVVFFFVPFAVRGARMSLRKTENNIKDWLPPEFRETSELNWFARYFVGERFIIVTWPGCTEDDQRLSILTRKLRNESSDESLLEDRPRDWQRARRLAEELHLLTPVDQYTNWGGRNEKWLLAEGGNWYFLTPDGHLFRWSGGSDLVGGMIRTVQRMIREPRTEGQFIAAFGSQLGEGALNPFYADPYLLCAPLFKSVQTGPELVAELSREGGPLWPINGTEPAFKSIIARRAAIDRLTGTLYAPVVDGEFAWSAEAFAKLLGEDQQARLPEGWQEVYEQTLKQVLDARFGGALEQLRGAGPVAHAEVWYALCDALEIDPPARETSLLVTLTELGSRNLHQVCGRGLMSTQRGRVLQLAEQSGVNLPPQPTLIPPPLDRLAVVSSPPEPLLRMGGPPIDNVAIDEEGRITLVRLVGYSAILGLALAYICLRNVKLTIMVFFVGGVSAAMCLGVVWWSGDGIDAILLTMPALVYVLGMSGAIHLVNYYRQEVVKGGLVGAPERMLAHAWFPCTLCSVTTAIGLLSLCSSNILPIYKFGLYSAIGVMGTLVLLFTYLPAALNTFVPSPPDNLQSLDDEESQNPFWARLVEWLTRHYVFTGVAMVGAMLVAGFGILSMRTSVRLLKMFDSDAQIIQDYSWLEQNFGKLVPMELVVRQPPRMQRELLESVEPAEQAAGGSEAGRGSTAESVESVLALNLLERAEAIARIQSVIERTFGPQGLDVAGRSLSAVTFLPDLPPPSNDYSPLRAKYNRELLAGRDQLLQSDYMRQELEGPYTDSELWRISLRISALSDVDYGAFVDQLRRAIEPVLEAYRIREQALRDVADARGGLARTTGQDGAGKAEFGHVLLLGLEKPQPLAQQPILRDGAKRFTADAMDAGRADESETGRLADAVDQRAIFAATLAELLDNAPLRPSAWQNPASVNGAGWGRSAEWGKALAKYDCVILLGDHPEYDLPFIRDHARKFIDYRRFDAADVEPTVINGIPSVSVQRPLQAIYTGVVPVVYKAQRTLLESLVVSFIWSFISVGLTMAALMAPGRLPLGIFGPSSIAYGLGAGLLTMLPNVFPVVLIFGLLGWLGVTIDIGTMMTASVAMGIAVDDTIHFLTHYRHYLEEGATRQEAVVSTYRRVAPAMLQTSIIAGVGLFVFALSTFTPTQRFGTLMLLLLGSAVWGDLLLLPALLVSPLGRVVRPRDRARLGDSVDVADAPLPQGSSAKTIAASQGHPPAAAAIASPPDHSVVSDGGGVRRRTDNPHWRASAGEDIR
jgi:predicted RND superfamily exporter protein